MNQVFILFFCLFFVANSVYADDLSDLQRDIHNIMQAHHDSSDFHGNVRIQLGDQTIYKKSFGIANEAFDVPHTERSRFMIASVSKQFTAAAIHKLAQDGLIDINKTYSTYMKLSTDKYTSASRWNTMTIKQLLTHRAGVVKDLPTTLNGGPQIYNPEVSTALFLAINSRDIFFTDPGEQFFYSNLGYMLLADLVSTIAGMDFHEYLEKNILKPLGMTSTGQYHRLFNIKNMAEGYYYADGTGDLVKRCCRDATSFIGSHSLYSDTTDLMIWLKNLNSEKPKVLTKESIKLMMTTAQGTLVDGLEYGHGLNIDKVKSYKRISHDGMEWGYLSLVSTIPSLNLNIVVLGNRHDGATDEYYTKKMNNQISELVSSYLEKPN